MKKFKDLKKASIALIMALLICMSGFAACGRKYSDAEVLVAEDYSYSSGKNITTRETMAAVNQAGSYYDEAEVEYEGISDYDSAAGSTANAPSEDVTVPVTSNNSQMLIRRVRMEVETTNFPSVTNNLQAKVKALGGYMESSQVYGTGDNYDLRTAVYICRVPSSELDELVNSVSGSTTVLSSQETTEDVTLSYADLQSHIASLRIEQESLMEMLADARDIDVIYSIQSRLTQVRYEIESYESQARLMANQVQYSTLTVTVNEVLEETEVIPTKKLSYGEKMLEALKDSLENIAEDAKDFSIGFVAALPYLLVFAIVVLIIVLVIKAIVKSILKKSKAKKEVKKVAPAPKATTATTETKTEDKKTE